jgi:hypothetical protein
MAKKWIIGIVLAAVGSCAACGVAVLALGAAAEDETAPVTAVAVSGAHPAELVAFWDGGFDKLALFADGTAKKYIRQAWLGGNAPAICAVKADLVGGWSVSGNQLSVELTQGKWQDCNGARDFEAFTETFTWRLESTPNSASPFGITLWLKSATGEDGFNKKCIDPGSCPGYLPDPL